MVPGARVLVASLTSADQRQFLLGHFQRISVLQYWFNDSVNAAKFIHYEENCKAALQKIIESSQFSVDTVQFSNAVDAAEK